jgi:predicted aldo/keto reductase-like oxidoreductase
MDDQARGALNRRRFLAGAGLAAASAGAWALSQGTGDAAPPAGDAATLRAAARAQYRKLGKINKMVSPIGIGTASIKSPAVLDRAIDLGLNYIDTAHCYMSGRSETEVGKVLKKRRDEVVLTTKWHPGATAKRQEMLDSLDDSLKSLQTDHIDTILVHSVEDAARIQNPEVMEAFQIAKKAGKVSHLGMSSHSPNMIEVTREAMRLGWYEIVLLKYSYMSYPGVGALIKDLHAAGIAVTVMKTRDGARHVGLADFEKGDGFVGAALRWAASNPHIASAVISLETFEEAELYARVAGQPLASRTDLDLLHKYAQTFGKEHCRGCGDCGPACPNGVKVWEVDRAMMYFDRYQHERRGMDLYAALGEPAAACAGCAAPCESACAYQIPIRDQLTRAHRALSWGADPHHPLLG